MEQLHHRRGFGGSHAGGEDTRGGWGRCCLTLPQPKPQTPCATPQCYPQGWRPQGWEQGGLVVLACTILPRGPFPSQIPEVPPHFMLRVPALALALALVEPPMSQRVWRGLGPRGPPGALSPPAHTPRGGLSPLRLLSPRSLWRCCARTRTLSPNKKHLTDNTGGRGCPKPNRGGRKVSPNC